ncbi:MAG: PaREP1 family protein, partial [Candidatus Methanomethylicia archaeon]
ILEIHAELAERFLEEGKQLIDKDPVQTSEKLYKAAEECIKALAIHFKFEDILVKVRERGRWTVTELEKSTSRISDKLGKWFYDAWAQANYLHVWGFHEAKLDIEDVKKRLVDIDRMIMETRKTLRKA